MMLPITNTNPAASQWRCSTSTQVAIAPANPISVSVFGPTPSRTSRRMIGPTPARTPSAIRWRSGRGGSSRSSVCVEIGGSRSESVAPGGRDVGRRRIATHEDPHLHRPRRAPRRSAGRRARAAHRRDRRRHRSGRGRRARRRPDPAERTRPGVAAASRKADRHRPELPRSRGRDGEAGAADATPVREDADVRDGPRRPGGAPAVHHGAGLRRRARRGDRPDRAGRHAGRGPRSRVRLRRDGRRERPRSSARGAAVGPCEGRGYLRPVGPVDHDRGRGARSAVPSYPHLGVRRADAGRDDRRHGVLRRRAHRVHLGSFTLEPGDVITTGTPAGVGVARVPPRFLRPGDVVRIEIDGLGAIEHPVVGS